MTDTVNQVEYFSNFRYSLNQQLKQIEICRSFFKNYQNNFTLIWCIERNAGKKKPYFRHLN